MSLARRSITSVAWNSVANLIKVVVLFIRSVLLARLLPVQTFGVYTGASAVVGLTVVVASFGMGGAFLHRAPETEDESEAAAVHFTLKLLFTAGWAVLLAVATLLFASGPTRTALLLLVATTTGVELAQTPKLILTRRVVHRRLALLQVANALLTTLVAVGLAWQGVTLWALLATDMVSLVLTLVALYLWRPVWRPRLAWSREVVCYYLRFGSRNFVAVALLRVLDRLDDLWTRFYLGTTPLGYYSRAYAFATYPRRVLAAPINMVAGGTYAELKEDRQRLSQAFFRTNAFLIRSGFFLAGLLALVAPEFIRLVLGAKWLPMLDAFRLMLVFTLLDPIKATVGDLFVVLGRPEQVVRARGVQLVVLVIGLLLLGPLWGITGVALAVDGMLIVGMAILLWQARAIVDFSLPKLLGPPAVGLITGLVLAHWAASLPYAAKSDWHTGAIKLGLFLATYVMSLLLLERDQLVAMLSGMIRQLRPNRMHPEHKGRAASHMD